MYVNEHPNIRTPSLMELTQSVKTLEGWVREANCKENDFRLRFTARYTTVVISSVNVMTKVDQRRFKGSGK